MSCKDAKAQRGKYSGLRVLFFCSQSRKAAKKNAAFYPRRDPVGIPILPIYFLGESPEGFEDVPILEPLKGTNWRQKAEAIHLLLQLGVPKAEIAQKLGLSEEDIQRI